MSKIPQIEQPSQLHDAIIGYYQQQISQGDATDISVLGAADFVPNQEQPRQVLLEIGTADIGDLENDGRFALILECTLYGVISKAQTDAGLQAMNLAAALARHVQLNTWGYSTKAVSHPQKIALSESFLIKGGDQYAGFEAWEVSWHQGLKMGAPRLPRDPDYPDLDPNTVIDPNAVIDPGTVTDPLVTGFFLAVNPEDSNDINQYKKMEGPCLHNGISGSSDT